VGGGLYRPPPVVLEKHLLLALFCLSFVFSRSYNSSHVFTQPLVIVGKLGIDTLTSLFKLDITTNTMGGRTLRGVGGN